MPRCDAAPLRHRVGNRFKTATNAASEADGVAPPESGPKSEAGVPQMHAGSSETLAPLLDEQGVRSDAATTVAAVPARDTDIFTITIESLVPVRGHIIDASRTETVAQLKVRYLKVLQEQAMALHMACANTPSEAPNPTRPPASAQSRRAREMASPTVCPEFETHCRFIFDGIEVRCQPPRAP